jgi:transglutaminase-like putative cysteine protease
MFLAPTPQLHGTIGFLAPGAAGVFQTLRIMREMVRKYRTDPRILTRARSIVFLTPEKNEAHEAQALFAFVRDSIRYTRDVLGVETLSTPDKTLAARVGDCDDQVTLLATLLESVGYPTRFVVAAYYDLAVFEHVYLQTLIGGEWVDMDPTEREACGWSPPGALAIHYEDV